MGESEMITSKKKQAEYYHALKERDRSYDGIIFCRNKNDGDLLSSNLSSTQTENGELRVLSNSRRSAAGRLPALQNLSALVISAGNSGRSSAFGECSGRAAGKTLEGGGFFSAWTELRHSSQKIQRGL